MNNREITILVVEDDTQIRNFISYALKQEDFSCLTASTAQNAMSAIVSQKIDLVLLDLGLPDFDGMEVIKKVREFSDQTPPLSREVTRGYLREILLLF